MLQIKPKAVVWDIDDVLTPTSLAFYQTALKTHGSCPHPDDWSDYAWGQHINLDEGFETQSYLSEHNIIEHSDPYVYTKEALSLTHNRGFKNILLSARAWHDNPHHITKTWAEQHSFDRYITAMHFVKVEESKRDHLLKLGEDYDLFAFVEDNPAHALSAMGFVPYVYLVRRSWNVKERHHPNLIYTDTALEAARHLTHVADLTNLFKSD